MRKIVSITIIIVVCIFSLNSYAADFNELSEKRNEIQSQIESSTEQLEDVNNELSQNLQQIQKIDENIATTQSNLDELKKKITDLENQITTVQNSLQIVQEKYDEQKRLLDARLIAMYEAGDTNYLDVLLTSSNISEFISNYFLITELTSYDINLLETVEEEKKEIEAQKEKLANSQKLLDEQKKNQTKTQKVLENTKTVRQSYIAKLSEEEQSIQAEIDEYNNQISIIEQEIKNLAVVASFGEEYQGGTMQWPIPNHYKITSNFGMRTHPITGVYKLHTGMDISAPPGTDFLSAAYGVVVKATYNTAYGNMVIIDHGGGVQTLYAHGSSIEVQVGQIVSAGDVVIKVGSTGYSTGAHAHFEVRLNGEYLNPLDYVSIPEE